MSLRPDDHRSSRSKSKSGSRDGRDRSRSRSNVRAPETVSAPEAPSPPAAPRHPYPSSSAAPGSYSNGVTSPSYDVRSPTGAGAERPGYFGQKPERSGSYGTPSAVPYPMDEGGYVIDYKDFPPEQRPGYVPPAAQMPMSPVEDGLAYGDIMSPSSNRQHSFQSAYPSDAPSLPYPAMPPAAPSYQYHQPEALKTDSRSSSYTYQYAQVPSEITYTAKPQSGSNDVQHSHNAQGPHYEQLPRSYSHDKSARTVEVAPGYGIDKPERKSSSSKGVHLSLSTGAPGSLDGSRSPGLTAQTSRLSVGGAGLGIPGQGHAGPGDLPPPSPLLEPYRGTYQQMSPLPMMLRPKDDDDELDMLPPLSPQVSRTVDRDDKLSRDAGKATQKKSVKLHDSESEAKALSKALSGHKVDADVICDILPGMSHDQVMYLRKEYKKQVKVQGKGVNLSKHLKTKLTGNFGKAAYVTALGRWESEGYWANFFYQSHGSRRELLIESLMGRTNIEIWNIKDEFKDKRYSDNLVKCMEQELKMDKFRTAVLMVLEERRQEEQDVYPVEYRNRDVEMLNKALTAQKGGESTMLEIIVRRSDAHLREVLKTYERMYQQNLAHAVIKKSSNLVGEVITHILNGVINKPARDSLLLHHAIQDIREKNREDELRYELLISRLVRLHWDKQHLARVKRTYLDKYKSHLESDIEDATKGDFAEFMIELCNTQNKA